MTDRPHIDLDPAVQGGEACFQGTRLPVEIFARMWWDGVSLEERIMPWLDNYGFGRRHLLLACWWMARYGSRTWRKRWADWLHQNERKLSDGDYAAIPLPPRRAE